MLAITLIGCKLFCATQRNLHQVNVQVLHLCVDEALKSQTDCKRLCIVQYYVLVCVLKAKELYDTQNESATFLKARQSRCDNTVVRSPWTLISKCEHSTS